MKNKKGNKKNEQELAKLFNPNAKNTNFVLDSIQMAKFLRKEKGYNNSNECIYLSKANFNKIKQDLEIYLHNNRTEVITDWDYLETKWKDLGFAVYLKNSNKYRIRKEYFEKLIKKYETQLEIDTKRMIKETKKLEFKYTVMNQTVLEMFYVFLKILIKLVVDNYENIEFFCDISIDEFNALFPKKTEDVSTIIDIWGNNGMINFNNNNTLTVFMEELKFFIEYYESNIIEKNE